MDVFLEINSLLLLLSLLLVNDWPKVTLFDYSLSQWTRGRIVDICIKFSTLYQCRRLLNEWCVWILSFAKRK